jgi:hypothetical protein
MCCVIQEYVAVHEMWKERKSTCSVCVGGPGRLPAPSPALLAEPWGGGGGLAGWVLPGDFEQGRGGSLASKPRVEMAGFSGK